MTAIFRFGKYGAVAAGSALVDWAMFLVLTTFGVYYLNAQMAARVAGGMFSFVGNKFWSFRRADIRRTPIEGRRFLLLYAFSYGLSLLMLHLLVDVIDLSLYLAKLLADTTCFVVNFVVMQIYVFHDRAGWTRFLPRHRRANVAKR